MPTVAEVLARGLRTGNVARVFGLPGGEVVYAMEAVRRERLPFVLTRHEAAAAFMAAATARLTRSPGACLTTLGPGAANATVGLAHAYLDRDPVVLITGQMAARLRPRHTHQYLDLHALFAPISKASLALAPAGAAEAVRGALQLAQGGRPGPVHLQLTSDDARSAAEPADPPGAIQIDLGMPEPEIERRQEMAGTLVGRARRPIVLCGLGLEPQAPYAELLALCEALDAPVITTPKAKGALAEGHPLAAGVIGLTPSDPAYAVLEEADCVLAVGFDPVELVRPWGHSAPLVWIAPWQNADPVLPAAAEIVGELAPTLRRLALVRSGTERAWGESRVARHRSDAGPRPPQRPAPGRMAPQQVLATLRQVMPEETVVSVDVGSHKILACLRWSMALPNRFLVSNGLSSMGYGLPAAVAARLALPDVPSLCLSGDAGLAMALGELGTLADVGGPLVVVAFKDDALDLIRSHQRRAGLPPFGTEFRGSDLVRIAEAHGVEGVHATTAGALAEAAERALRRRAPVLIEAVVDPAGYPTTPDG